MSVPERTSWADTVGERTRAVLERVAAEQDPAMRRRLVNEVVILNLPLARSLAMRYQGRGVPVEDLVQVSALALLGAVHRFDVERGHTSFLAYAVPTMTGELKRYFRDNCWLVRPPRGLQELRGQVSGATQVLSQQLGRAPTEAELAQALQVDQERVIEVVVCGDGYTAARLDTPVTDDGLSWIDVIPDPDIELRDVPERVALQDLLASLPERERRILALRFYTNRTQTQIGAEVGVTQMQVSRLLGKILRRLRYQLEADHGAASSVEAPTRRPRPLARAR